VFSHRVLGSDHCLDCTSELGGEWIDSSQNMKAYRVIGPNFVASIVINERGTIVRAAPILRRYRSLEELEAIAYLRDWMIKPL